MPMLVSPWAEKCREIKNKKKKKKNKKTSKNKRVFEKTRKTPSTTQNVDFGPCQDGLPLISFEIHRKLGRGFDVLAGPGTLEGIWPSKTQIGGFQDRFIVADYVQRCENDVLANFINAAKSF